MQSPLLMEKSDFTNVSELKPDEILSITNVNMHVLSSGYALT